MALVTAQLPSIGAARGDEEIDVRNVLVDLLAQVNGNLDTSNLKDASAVSATELTAALASSLGVNASGVVRRGKVNIPAEESRNLVAYGLLATADRVQQVVLPADGKLLISYFALSKIVGAASGKVRITLNGNPIKIAGPAGAQTDVESIALGQTNYGIVATSPSGISMMANTGADHAGPWGTGQVIGHTGSSGGATGGPAAAGTLEVFADAGTYDVAVEWAVTNVVATVFAKLRRLWVEAVAFS